MKKIRIFLLLSVFLFTFFSCGDSSFNSVEYDNVIQYEIDQFNSTYLFYVKSLKTKDAKDIELKKQNTLKQISSSLAHLDSLSKSEQDENYLERSINYLNKVEHSISVTDSSYLSLQKKDSLLTQQDSVLMNNLVKERLYSCDKAFLEFQLAQKKFREKYGLIKGKE